MSSSKKASKRASPSNTLLVLVLDVSPLAWGDRDFKRTASDRARAAAGKGSVGPAVLEEVLDAVQAFSNAVLSLERDACPIISCVAGNETAVVYPRKNHLAQWLSHPESYTPDTRRIKEDLIKGVAELVARTVAQSDQQTNVDPVTRQAAMAAAFSAALCVINRLFLAAQSGGVSALHNEHYLDRVDDQGVVALMKNGSSSSNNDNSNKKISAWSPRILLIQASEDRARDYNAFMNCAFAANKNNITVDGCFLSDSATSSSAFLEQVCDLTGGVFSAPSGMAQIGGALTEVLLSIFLAPLNTRPSLHLPALNKVDFRARCFETASTVDRAYVCNQCLSIFRHKPTTSGSSGGYCPTCQAKILVTESSAKRKRQSISSL